jgi:hypothetical protein
MPNSINDISIISWRLEANTSAVDYDADLYVIDLCSLLDAIEQALNNKDYARAGVLVAGRFSMAKDHGLEIVVEGKASDLRH